MHASLQRKFSFSYIAIILAVLILLNTYPLITSENLTFRSKQSSLQGSVSVMVTALSGLEELSEENVAGAMTLVEETGISRVLVTDASGRVLYDTRETDGAIGRYAFYTELVQALRGEDVFYTEFSDKAFKSRAASPVIYHSQTIGAVYAYEYDTEQAELLLSLQRNLLTISAVVLVFAGGISVLLSRVLTRRFGVLTDAIRKMREGSYSHRAEVGGHDEISELAAEFNDMADRLQTTEDARRRFVSDASHELKTPLAGIRLLSDSILQTENMDAQTVREFVGDIEQESERLARITENLLRLTRLDSGMLPEAQRVDLSSVMARVVRMLRLVAEEKQVDLSYEIRREGQTLASEDEIHEIIYNLTENAIKYNRPGGFVKLLLAGPDEPSLSSPIPEGTALKSLKVSGRRAQIDLSAQYARLTGIDLSLADYCITLTLTQLPNVNAVSITADGRELPYRETQVLLSADTLLSSRESGLRPITVSLYFLDSKTGELRAEQQTLALYEGQTRVNALLEALAQGPEDDSLVSLLPEDFAVISSRIENGVCYLNLPANVSLPENEAERGLMLSALEQSILSLGGVDEVQFLIEGSAEPDGYR